MSGGKTTDFAASDYAVGRPWLNMRAHELDTGERWWTGTYQHPRGIADVYQHGARGRQQATTMIRFVHEGRCYTRTWDCLWSDRTVSRLCRELVEDVAGEWA